MVTNSYRDLIAWQKSMALVTEVYDLTKNFPKEESYVLTSQIRRAAISVPANIAEGSSRGTTKDFMRFLDISKGSLKELETHLLMSESLGLIKSDDCKAMLKKTDEIGKILYYLKGALSKKLEAA